ncbi:MAG: ATP-binding protein [Acidobacteria bacterium]|nr:ATP-binding protein [Acidobacteriota bacterium]
MAPDMEIVASQAASAMATFVGMSPDRVDEVRMAVVEACINAFEHSHASERKVEITFRLFGAAGPERLEIRVHDRGVGFHPDRVEEPNLAEKLKGERKRGWGLKIIQGLMDEVEILSGSQGTTVVMSKSR